jgi:hypothetical protein
MNKYLRLILSLLIATACSDNISSDPQLKTFSKVFSEVITTGSIDSLFIENHHGGIIFTGWGIQETIKITVTKTIRAENQTMADENFHKIQLQKEQQPGRLNFLVAYPANSKKLEYEATNVAFELPYHIKLFVSHSNSSVLTDQMNSELNIEYCAGPVFIHRHLGSCSVYATNHITADIILPDNGGYCNLRSTTGTIELAIPETTSATFNAVTFSGNISYENLGLWTVDLPYRLSGTFGSGSSDINLETQSGDILITGF